MVALGRVYLVPGTRADRFVLAHLSNPDAWDRVVAEIESETGQPFEEQPSVQVFLRYIIRDVLEIRDSMQFDGRRYHLWVPISVWLGRGLPAPPTGGLPDPIDPNTDPERPVER